MVSRMRERNRSISAVFLVFCFLPAQFVFGLEIYAVCERDSWLKRFRLEKDRVVEKVRIPLTGGGGVAVLPIGVVVVASNSEVMVFDRNLRHLKTRRFHGLSDREVPMWGNGSHVFVSLFSGVVVLNNNLRELSAFPPVRDFAFNGQDFTAIADQDVPCVPANDIPCYVPSIYIGGPDKNGIPEIQRKMPLSGSRDSVSGPNAQFFVPNEKEIGIIINGMAPGKRGFVAIQKTTVFDRTTQAIKGNWNKSYQQARAGYGFGKEDEGSEIVVTTSWKGGWGVVRRGSEFFLADLSIKNDRVVIGQRHNLYLGIGTYDGQVKTGRISIGTLTPHILMRGHGENLVLSIDHVLFVIGMETDPRVIARYISGEGYTATISGFDIAD